MDVSNQKSIDVETNLISSSSLIQMLEDSSELFEQWKKKGIYPFKVKPVAEEDKLEQRMYDLLVLLSYMDLPQFGDSRKVSKRNLTKLIQHAIEDSPSELNKIMNEVIELPKSKGSEFSELLDRTKLAHILSASKIVTNRLEFISGLEKILFDADLRKHVKERSQLHRILADNAWIFGEQYNLAVDDQSLTEVLKEHIKSQKLEIEINSPVLQPNGKKGIVDLMFSRNAPNSTGMREHLIVELKRPKKVINVEAANQIEQYALSVALNPRFNDVPANWEFWLVSNEIDDAIKKKINQSGRPYGVLFKTDNPSITIWVKTWSEIIQDCKNRMQYLSQELEYTPDQSESLLYLKDRYKNILAELVSH